MKRAENEGRSGHFGPLRTLIGLSMTFLHLPQEYELCFRGCDVDSVLRRARGIQITSHGESAIAKEFSFIGDRGATVVQADACSGTAGEFREWRRGYSSREEWSDSKSNRARLAQDRA